MRVIPLKIMQHVWVIGSSNTTFTRNGKTFMGIVPGVRDATVIFSDDKYVGYVADKISPHEFRPLDLKMTERKEIYDDLIQAEAAADREMTKFLEYEDGRDYWAKNKHRP